MVAEANGTVGSSGAVELTAGRFTGRCGLETVFIEFGEAILRRNVDLRNVPGFLAGEAPTRTHKSRIRVAPRTESDALERDDRRSVNHLG